MDPNKSQDIESLIKQMIYFLDSSSEEERSDDSETEESTSSSEDDDTDESEDEGINCEEDDEDTSDNSENSINGEHPHEDIVLPGAAIEDLGNMEPAVVDLPGPSTSLNAAFTNLYNSQPVANHEQECELVETVKKISQKLPLWKTSDTVSWNPIFDPVWRNINYKIPVMPNPEKTGAIPKTPKVEHTNTKVDLETKGPRIGKTYVQEVNHAIYCSTANHPVFGSPEYFKAAENYAICGETFLDFSDHHVAPVVNEKSKSNVTPDDGAALNTGSIGNGLSPTPTYRPSGSGLVNYSKPPISPPSTANGGQGSYLKNSVPYHIRPPAPNTVRVPMHEPPPYGSPNRSPVPTSVTNNFIPNNLGNVLTPPPGFLYPRPITPQLCTGGSHSGTAVVYERFLYAQLVQNQLVQSQQTAVASMIQQTSRPLPFLATGACGGTITSSVSTRTYSVISPPQEFSPTQTSTPSNSTLGSNIGSPPLED